MSEKEIQSCDQQQEQTNVETFDPSQSGKKVNKTVDENLMEIFTSFPEEKKMSAEEKKFLNEKHLPPLFKIRSCYIPKPTPKFNTETQQNKERAKLMKEYQEKRAAEGWTESELSEEDKVEMEKMNEERKVIFSKHCVTDVNAFVGEYNDNLKVVVEDLEYFAEIMDEWYSSIDEESVHKQLEWGEYFSNDPGTYKEQLKYQESYEKAKILSDTATSLASIGSLIARTAHSILHKFF